MLSTIDFGAVFNDNGTLKITNATISDNAAPNIQRQAGSVILANTIVASGVGGSGANCARVVTSAGHNLDTGNTCSFTTAGNLTGTDPLLGPLPMAATTPLAPASINGASRDRRASTVISAQMLLPVSAWYIIRAIVLTWQFDPDIGVDSRSPVSARINQSP